jgi:REP element-mobilizing transposase RayT
MASRDGVLLPEPLAYFLTWPTYGTWLSGDERGWVKREHGHQLPDPPRKLEAMARMAEDACRLDEVQRELAERTIAEHCRVRGWTLHAVNCRTNHLHVVVTANRHPDEVRDQFKAWSARRLKELQAERATDPTSVRAKWWAERGSKRYLNDVASLEAAILYVRDGQ